MPGIYDEPLLVRRNGRVDALPNISVTVRKSDGNPASLLSWADGSAIGNPVASDDDGNLRWQVAELDPSYFELVYTAPDGTEHVKRVRALPKEGGASADAMEYVPLVLTGTDETGALQAAINAAMAPGGDGTVNLRTPGVTRIDGQITFPTDQADPATVGPRQRSLRITGQGSSHNGQGGEPLGGSILDMRYALGPKMTTRGLGHLTLEHLTLQDTTDGTQPFLHTTNTTCLIDDVEFYGKTSATSALPTQDAIILGGLGLVHNGTIDAPFQGYGTLIRGCHFNRIRRGVYGRMYSNNLVVRDNTWWVGCGADATAAAIEIDPTSTASVSGWLIEGNIFEINHYVHVVKLTYANNCVLGPNGFYDPPASGLLALYRLGPAAIDNLIIDGFRTTNLPLYVADTPNRTTVLTALQSQETKFAQPVRFAQFVTHAGSYGQRILNPSNVLWAQSTSERFADTAAERFFITRTPSGGAEEYQIELHRSHWISQGSAPTITGTVAGTFAVAGTDTAGVITITSAAGGSVAGRLCTVNYNKGFRTSSTFPKGVQFSPANAAAAALGVPYVDAQTHLLFALGVPIGMGASTEYKWNYTVIG